MRHWWEGRALLVCAIVFCMLTPIVVDAKGGGGGHGGGGGRSSSSSSRSSSSYSRSSGSSGSSRSSGSGGGTYFFGGNVDDTLFLLAIGIGIAIWIVVKVVEANQDGSPSRASDDASPESVAPLDLGGPTKQATSFIAYRLADLKKRDPLFDESHFIGHTRTVFALLAKARNDNNVASVLRYLDERETERLTEETQQAMPAGKRRVVEDAVVSGAEIYRFEKHFSKDAIIVRIDASARDYYVDNATGKAIAGSERPSPYTEYWTFERPENAKTGEAHETDGSCPQCGAPLALGNPAFCQACGTSLPARQNDWLLTAIMQSTGEAAAPAPASAKHDYLATLDARPIMRDIG